MRDVVIVEPVRTAVGGFGGSYKDVHAHVLGTPVVSDERFTTALVDALLRIVGVTPPES